MDDDAGWWTFLRRFINPAPFSREWRIAYRVAFFLMATAFMAAILYRYLNPL